MVKFMESLSLEVRRKHDVAKDILQERLTGGPLAWYPLMVHSMHPVGNPKRKV
jgi:hypothetical protein